VPQAKRRVKSKDANQRAQMQQRKIKGGSFAAALVFEMLGYFPDRAQALSRAFLNQALENNWST
jgi:hypothetical protein